MTISIRVKPTWRFAEPGRPRAGRGPIIRLMSAAPAPVDVHEVLALRDGDGDAAARRAAIGIEADGAALVVLDLRLRGVELELEPFGQLVRLRLARDRVFARIEVERERGIAARGHGSRLRLAQRRGERARGSLEVVGRGAAEHNAHDQRVGDRRDREDDDDLEEGEAPRRGSHQLVMSRFSPSPPGWLSAPSEIRSKGLLVPGTW